ncbi:hypothetical protein HYV82_01700 [Candidatus Woesearchaeota archaeon]|nr:hypothetical protein [Candidatus Woesearchaeota archaeon]
MIPGAPNFSAYLATFGQLEARVLYEQEMTPPDSPQRHAIVDYAVLLNGKRIGIDRVTIAGDLAAYRTYQGKVPMPSGEMREVSLKAECNGRTGFQVRRVDVHEGIIPYPYPSLSVAGQRVKQSDLLSLTLNLSQYHSSLGLLNATNIRKPRMNL